MDYLKANKKLPRQFYIEEPEKLAPQLLGKILVKKEKKTVYAGKIVEVEAYKGFEDPAAHSFNGKTKRNEVMFEKGGLLYVYFTYGMHFCANVTAGEEGVGWAVLLRGLEPLEGLGKMALNRFAKKDITKKEQYNLTNGPGKICQAIDIKRDYNGSDLTGEEIYVLNAPSISKKDVIVTKRIGIKKAVDFPWRFYIKDNPYISKK